MPREFKNDLPLLKTIPERSEKTVSESYQIKIVTPMFGGGGVAGENDSAMPIRSTSIRGHLRFWWRAIRGSTFGSTEKMLEAENSIWGSTEIPSKVTVRVVEQLQHSGIYREPADETEAHVFFAARTDRNQLLGEGGRFKIEITYPKTWENEDSKMYRLNVEAVVWAWVNFGGIGARTRRGGGSLFCKDLVPQNIKKLSEWFSENLNKYEIEERGLKNWPTFPLRMYCQMKSSVPLSAWTTAVTTLKDFRQGAGTGRNGKQGRSFWPEPDAIRKITGQSDKNRKHDQPFPTKKVVEKVFPRAEFGLPIIFKFKGDKKDQDPRQTELLPVVKGETMKRMGSPLILKPLVMQDGNAVPLVMLLNTRPIEEVVLEKSGDKTHYPVRSENLQYDNSPLKDQSPNGSAIEGFLKFIQDEKKEYKFKAVVKKEVSK